MANTINGALLTNASVSAAKLQTAAGILSAQLAQRATQRLYVPLTSARVWDAPSSLLPSAGATDDLGILPGTWGTNQVTLQTGDLKAAGATTRYAMFQTALPRDYDDDETIQLEVKAGMATTVSDGTATVDAEIYAPAGDETVGSDLCTTAATTINTLLTSSVTTVTFSVTDTGLVAGDPLEIRLAVAISDAASATAVIGVVTSVTLLYDARP